MMGGKKEEGKAGSKKDDAKQLNPNYNTRGAGSRPSPSGQTGTRDPKTPERAGNVNVNRTPNRPQNADSANIEKILSKLDNLDVKIDSTKNHLSDRIDSSTTQTENLAKDCAKVKAESVGIKTQMTVHGLRLSELEARIEQLEREKRKTSLVIDGIKETEDEDVAETVEEVFADLGVDYNTRVCINIYRRGRKQNKDQIRAATEATGQSPRPRPIIVVFLRHTEKSQIFQKLKNLKGNDKWKNVYFNDDFTEIQATEQRDLRSLVAYAKKIGKEASIRAGAFWYQGRKYLYHDLHRLPAELSLLKAKTLHILEDTAILFQSPHTPLSNLFPCNLVFRGECFLSSEGAFQYHRALTSGYEKEAIQIKAERNPYKAKSQGGLIRATQEWDRICEELMEEILVAKFTMIEYCREFLLETGERRLLEGTGDKKWGCGVPLSKYWLATLKYPGKNILGLLLENIRATIRTK